jgi:N-methylhydantoinase A
MAFENEIAGWPIRTPRIDIHTVGAGGGSVAWIDGGGLLQVGPTSAGADPGPASYGQGGIDATVTDAHVVLGRLGSSTRLAGGLSLDEDAARAAVEGVATELEYGVEEAAAGILDIVNATMVRAIRLISLEHGHDPRKYSLIAFGGAGPLHACDLVDAMQLRNAVVPPRPGLLCALGLLAADVRVDASITRRVALVDEERGAIADNLAEVERELRESTAVRSRPELEWTASYTVDMRYVGQSFELTLPIPSERLGELATFDIDRAFDELHQTTYGHAPLGAPKEIMRFRASLHARSGTSIEQLPRIEGGPTAADPEERALFFREVGWVDSPVHRRESLRPGDVVAGPAVVEQMDATTVVAPGFTATVDAFTNLVLERAPQALEAAA